MNNVFRSWARVLNIAEELYNSLPSVATLSVEVGVFAPMLTQFKFDDRVDLMVRKPKCQLYMSLNFFEDGKVTTLRKIYSKVLDDINIYTFPSDELIEEYLEFGKL